MSAEVPNKRNKDGIRYHFLPDMLLQIRYVFMCARAVHVCSRWFLYLALFHVLRRGMNTNDSIESPYVLFRYVNESEYVKELN